MQTCTPLSAGIDDVRYPATYQRTLSPAWLRYAAAVHGVRAVPLDAPFRYLELGCGQGLSVIVHAAAFPRAEFHACDADGRCMAAARQLSRELALDNLTLHHASFAELGARPLGSFDFIAAHGVYSWVDAEARQSLRTLLGDRLASGGVAYLSYNCLPGWTAEGPLQRMMAELAATSAGDGAARVRGAAQALAELARDWAYFRLYPEAAAAAAAYLQSPAGYLAHELLAPAFQPFYSVDVGEEMAAAGLRPLGSATLADAHPELLVSPRTADRIAALPAARQRELAMDFAVNRRFRRDLFVRADAAPPPGDSPAPLWVGCPGDPGDVAHEIRVPRGRIRFDAGFVAALRDRLAGGSATLESLIDGLCAGAGDRSRVARNLLYLVAGGELVPFAGPCAVPPSPGRALRFASVATAAAVARAAASSAGGWVPSPAAGAGVALSRTDAQAVAHHVSGAAATRPRDARLLTRLARLGVLA